MNTSRIFITSTAGLLTLFTLVACSTSQKPAQPPTTESETASSYVSSSSVQPVIQETTPIYFTYTNDDVLHALDVAQNWQANSIVTSLDVNESNNTFEVELLDGDIQQEVKVAQPGDVVTLLDTDQSPDTDEISDAHQTKITASEAIKTALEHKNNLLIDSVELEKENGNLVWKVELNNLQGQDQGEILIDALDGSIAQ